MLDFQINKSFESDIANHLFACDSRYVEKLSKKISIHHFSQKIYLKATRFEFWDFNVLVGLVSCYLNDRVEKKAFINHVGVHRAYQRQGVSNKLLEKCINSAKDRGFLSIDLEVDENNEVAKYLYLRHGFESTGKLLSIESMRLDIYKGVNV